MIKIQEGSIRSDYTSAIYSAEDYGLEVMVHYPEGVTESYQDSLNKRLRVKDSNDSKMVIYGGNLTLTFSGPDRILKSIDAYTNKNKWRVDAVPLPDKIAAGSCLLEEKDSGSDRISFESRTNLSV